MNYEAKYIYKMKMKLPSTVFSAEPSSKMKTIAIVFLCFFFVLNTLAQKFQTHAKLGIETRWDMTDN